jgi:integrase
MKEKFGTGLGQNFKGKEGGRKMGRKRTRFPGVYIRERRRGRRKEQYFSIRFFWNGKSHEEGLGYASQGWTPERANEELALIKRNQRTGEGPKTLAEKRKLNSEQDEETRRIAEQEAERKVSFRAYFEGHYLPNSHKKKKTRLRELELTKKWLFPVIEGIPLIEIAPFHLEKVKAGILQADLTPRMVQYTFAVFRLVWNHARKHAIVNADSPTKQVRIPKFDNARTRFLTHEEAEALLENLSIRSQQLHDIALLSLHTGMRFSEIASLKWKDVHCKQDLAGRDDPGHLFIRDPKNSENGYAYLTPETKEMFLSMIRGGPEDLVFPNDNGERMWQKSYSFDRAVKQLGFNEGVTDRRDRVCFHTLRHTFASWHAMGGTDMYRLQMLMRHKTPSMTQRYAHLSEQSLKEATRAFAKGLNKTSKVVRHLKSTERKLRFR